MALRLGELVATLRADAAGFQSGMSAAQLSMRGLQRDAEGRLRTLSGQFISEGDAAGRGFADGIREHARRAVATVRRVGPAIAGIGVGIPAVVATTAAVLGLVAGLGAAAIAAKAFQLAVGPQMDAVADAADAAAAADAAHEKVQLKKALAAKLAAKGGDEYTAALRDVAAASRAAREADAALEQQMAGMPGPTRETSRAMAGLKKDYQSWSDAQAGTTMPVMTKGIQLLRSLLPSLTPFVRAAADAFGGMLDKISAGTKKASFKAWVADMASASGGALTRFITVLGNLGRGFAGLLVAFAPAADGTTGGLVRMTDAFADWATTLKGSSGLADFLTLARTGVDTLKALAGAALQVLVALGPLVGVGAQILLIFAGIVSGVPTPALTALAAVWMTVVVGMRAYAIGSAIATAATAVLTSSAWLAVAGWSRMMAVGLMAYVRIGAAAVLSAAATAAAWTGSALVAIGMWVAAVIRAAVVAVAQFAIMSARAVAWASLMAAQWFIAMGPIGWIIGAVVGLAALIIANWDSIKKFTGKTWDWIWGKVKSVGGLIVGYLTSIPLVATFLRHWDRIKTGTISRVAGLISYVRELPGRIVRAVGSLSSLLFSKGADIVRGLWSGIQSLGGWIADKVMSWARDVIPGPIARALGIASPSRVTRAQGRWIARGLMDGLTGSSKDVRRAAERLAAIVRQALTGRREKKALAQLGYDSKVLIMLAQREETAAKRLKAANKQLAELKKKRAALAADVKRGILDAANITSDSDGPTSADSILDRLKWRLGQAKQFAEQLATLRKRGVRADLIAQAAQAGIDGGGLDTANALAGASAEQIKQINETQRQLAAAAGKAGNTAGDAMYGAGIRAAQGLVAGLESEQSSIEKAMLRIAKGMTKAIRAALGIKSPSRVLADQVGRWIPAGIRRGIDAGAPALDRSMASLVTPPTMPALGARPLSTRADAIGPGSRGPIVLEIRSSGTAHDDFILEAVQRGVRVRGGDVQLVIAGRR